MDDRTYIRLHDGMPDHPKVVGLSDGAFRLYVESICWCGRHLTDGVVPAAGMRRMGGWSPEAVSELADATLIEADGETHWLIHDYTEHQRTAEEVAAIRRAKRAAGATGNHDRWHVARGLRDPDCELCAIPDDSHDPSHMRSDMPSHVQSLNGSGSDPMSDRKHHRETSPETETDTEEQKKTIVACGSDDDPDFTAFWKAYPRKIAKGHARKAWRGAVRGRRIEPKLIILTAEQFRDAVKAARTEQRFIPHPATWLNGERYGDEAAGEDDNGTPRRFDYPDSPYARGN
jgi:hypothetical protein